MADDHDIERELADLEAALRRIGPDDLQLLAPPDEVWAAITASLPDVAAAASVVDPVAPSAPSLDNVTSLTARRRRLAAARRPLLLVAAAVVLIVAGVAVFAASRGSDATVLATADLTFDPGAFDPLGRNATAEVSLLDDDGRYEIAIDRAALPDTATEDADLELWLIKPDADGNVAALVSLGVVDSTDQRFAVPPGIDPAAYDVVDISVEPHDGNHDHSGRSILRGTLSA
jgi:anti-sigma-K factor RskA